MRRLSLLLAMLLTAYLSGLSCQISPPLGWQVVALKSLPKEVKFFARSPETKAKLPPSVSIAVEETTLSLQEYLKIVEEEYRDHANCSFEWIKSISSSAGTLPVCRIECPTAMGRATLLQAMTVKEGYAYVITCTALSTEFAKNYKDFYNSIQSFTFLGEK